MRTHVLLIGAVLLLAASCMSGGAMRSDMPMSRSAVESMLSSWPDTAHTAAMSSMEKYGLPDAVTPAMLVWHDSGPWKRAIVYRDETPHDFPMPHKDVWEQFIDYSVPPETFHELAAFDGSVIAEQTKGELSARCDKEGANFLAINLAHDIITGKRTVQEARQFYARTMQQVMKGEMPPYVQGFQFPLPQMNTMDSDHPAPGMR